MMIIIVITITIIMIKKIVITKTNKLIQENKELRTSNSEDLIITL